MRPRGEHDCISRGVGCRLTGSGHLHDRKFSHVFPLNNPNMSQHEEKRLQEGISNCVLAMFCIRLLVLRRTPGVGLLPLLLLLPPLTLGQSSGGLMVSVVDCGPTGRQFGRSSAGEALGGPTKGDCQTGAEENRRKILKTRQTECLACTDSPF